MTPAMFLAAFKKYKKKLVKRFGVKLETSPWEVATRWDAVSYGPPPAERYVTMKKVA